MKINVYSEIGKLRRVLLHRPGKELENLAPRYLADLLFDDIPYLKKAQEEHDEFASLLRENGVEVKYITDLFVEAMDSQNNKLDFIKEFLDLSEINNQYIREALIEMLTSMNTREMVDKIISGVRTNELKLKQDIFSVKVRKAKLGIPFFLNPMPNLYFQRDPAATIGKGITINKMRTPARRREAMLMEYIINNHPEYKGTPEYYRKDSPYALEGGDVLVLNKKTLAVGISQRTDPEALEILAKNIFEKYGDTFESILGFLIPEKRAYMHLDTVFTMLDYDKFVVHPKLEGIIKIFVLKKEDKGYTVLEESGELSEILKRHLELEKATVIRCGDSDEIAAEREQWNDGSNALAIAPGKIVVYDRNYVTNRLFKEAGIEILEIPSSELSRGRGGPRCMSMPLFREE